MKYLNLLFIIAGLGTTPTTSWQADCDRSTTACKVRFVRAAWQTIEKPCYNILTECNGDDVNIIDFAGAMTKTLEHDPITGLLTPTGQASYKMLLQALQTQQQTDFNAITRAPGATMKLYRPQTAFAFSLQGADPSSIPMLPSPTLASAQAAADLIENYAMVLCRDVAYHDYGTGLRTDVDAIHGGSITNNVATLLQDIKAYSGPKKNNSVTPKLLFRANSTNCCTGPYISQFLLVDVYRLGDILQKQPQQQHLNPPKPNEFGISWHDFITMQNVIIPHNDSASHFLNVLRYPITGRDLACIVHKDRPF